MAEVIDVCKSHKDQMIEYAMVVNWSFSSSQLACLCLRDRIVTYSCLMLACMCFFSFGDSNIIVCFHTGVTNCSVLIIKSIVIRTKSAFFWGLCYRLDLILCSLQE